MKVKNFQWSLFEPTSNVRRNTSINEQQLDEWGNLLKTLPTSLPQPVERSLAPCVWRLENSRCITTVTRISTNNEVIRWSSRHCEPETAPRSDVALRGAAVSVIGGPGLAVGTATGVKAALHGSHTSHPHGLMERVALVLQGRQVKICNTIQMMQVELRYSGMGALLANGSTLSQEWKYYSNKERWTPNFAYTSTTAKKWLRCKQAHLFTYNLCIKTVNTLLCYIILNHIVKLEG